MKRFYLLTISLFLVISGCGNAGGLQQQEVQPVEVGKNAVVDQTKADQAKRLVAAMEEVIVVRGASYQENIYIAVGVKQFDRLRLESIRKTTFNKLKKRFPSANIHVSTDRKILMELEALEQRLKRNEIDEKALDKKLKKLEEDMKG